MSTRAVVTGYIDKGNIRNIVFNQTCNSLKDIQEAVEQAFDRNATTIVIKKIMPTSRGR